MGKEQFWLAVEGTGELIRDQNQMKEHWSESMAQWFKDGLETLWLVMIEVKATRAHYWADQDGGQIDLT